MQHEIIDFHTHHIPARFVVTAGQFAPADQRARWETLARTLADETLLLKDIQDGDIAARVVNIPAQLIADASGRVPHETIIAMNDELANLVSRHNGRIIGLASVDAYDGRVSAQEAERAIRDLGLRGLFVDCARGDLMLDAQEARPTLEVAAALGVPVFVHPVAPQPLTRQMAPYGVVGTLFARGTANSASLIALLEGGVFAQLPKLRIVVTALAFGGVAMAASLSGNKALDVMRQHVFIDTMWPQPALIRAAVDLLGADNVLAGSDWPIVDRPPLRRALEDAMEHARLTEDQMRAIASGNVRRFLNV